MIEWISVPFKVGGKRNIIAIVIPILMWGIILVYWGLGWLILSFFLSGVSTLPYFLPTRYKLTGDGIVVKSLFTKQEKGWENYKSFYVDKNGIFLSPFRKPSRLENFRGVYIRFHKNKEDVINFVKDMMEEKNGKQDSKGH